MDMDSLVADPRTSLAILSVWSCSLLMRGHQRDLPLASIVLLAEKIAARVVPTPLQTRCQSVGRLIGWPAVRKRELIDIQEI